MIGTSEIIIILFVVLLLFGPKKIPEIARGLGKGMNEFKKATAEIKKEINSEVNEIKSTTVKEVENIKSYVNIDNTLKND